MSSFLYYLPGRATAPNVPTHIADGLLDGRAIIRPVLGNGPDGGTGAIITSDPSVAGYYPDEQEWTQVGDVWLGWHQAKPQAADLARRKQMAGHWVVINGDRWLVPAARRFSFDGDVPSLASALPQRMAYQNGEWQFVGVAAQFERLWEIAQAWWDETMVANDIEATPARQPLTVADVAEMAVEALAYNYRVGSVEVSLLGLFDESVIRSVLDAVVDLPTYMQWVSQKKTTAQQTHDGASTSHGVAGY